MAQTVPRTLPSRRPGRADASKSKHSVTDKSHVLVRLIAEQGEATRGDSGRLVLDDDIDVPEVPDFLEWRGR